MRERDLWHNRANKSKNHFDISTNRKFRNKVTLIVPLMVEYMIKGRYFMPSNYKQKKYDGTTMCFEMALQLKVTQIQNEKTHFISSNLNKRRGQPGKYQKIFCQINTARIRA